MVTRAWKVYGADGHRQRESFFASYAWDCSEGDYVKFVAVDNSDKTGTNDYSIIRITRNTAKECEATLSGQLSYGAFENSRYGEVVEIDPNTGEELKAAKRAKNDKLTELEKREKTMLKPEKIWENPDNAELNQPTACYRCGAFAKILQYGPDDFRLPVPIMELCGTPKRFPSLEAALDEINIIEDDEDEGEE